MVDGPVEWPGRAELGDERRGDWRGRLHTRLSLLAVDQEGSDGGSGIRPDAEPVEVLSPVRDATGEGHPAGGSGQTGGSAVPGVGGGLRVRDDGNGRDREGREGPRIPPLKEIDHAQLPDAPHRHRRQAAHAASGLAAARLRNGAGVLATTDLAGKLERLSGRALDRADDILDLTLDDEDEKFGDKLRGLNAAIKTVVQTQVRVDEHRLKARKLDVLPELLAAIAAEERKRSLPGNAAIQP